MVGSAQIVTGFSLMSVKLLSESVDATITDEDVARIDTILAFWFKEQELTAPQIDRRMDIWFGEDAVFDAEVKEKFSGDVELASAGKLNRWAAEPRGRLALIILIDQFRRKPPTRVAPSWELTFNTIVTKIPILPVLEFYVCDSYRDAICFPTSPRP